MGLLLINNNGDIKMKNYESETEYYTVQLTLHGNFAVDGDTYTLTNNGIYPANHKSGKMFETKNEALSAGENIISEKFEDDEDVESADIRIYHGTQYCDKNGVLDWDEDFLESRTVEFDRDLDEEEAG
jgi:hypothetical protein